MAIENGSLGVGIGKGQRREESKDLAVVPDT